MRMEEYKSRLLIKSPDLRLLYLVVTNSIVAQKAYCIFTYHSPTQQIY